MKIFWYILYFYGTLVKVCTLGPFGIFCGHLKNFPFWYVVPKESGNPASLRPVSEKLNARA
jgi:hypothetical protein